MYGLGESDSTCADGRRVTILMFCSNEGLGEPVFVQEGTSGSLCEYFFAWNSCAACPLGDPARAKCPARWGACSSTGSTSSLSGGSVFAIVLFTLIVVYLAVGVAYKRFVTGAKGVDQIPHVDMWCTCLENVTVRWGDETTSA